MPCCAHFARRYERSDTFCYVLAISATRERLVREWPEAFTLLFRTL